MTRPSRYRRTVYEANDFYGSERILRRHADWDRPIKAVIPHGVPLNPYFAHRQIIGWPVPYILPYSWISRAWGEASAKHVVLSAAPFVYLVDAVERVPEPARNPPADRRLLFFPSHSTVAVTASPSSTEALRRLEELRSSGWDCTVCIYWRDQQLGRSRPFEQRGLRVVTCGHRADPAFTSRLVHLLLNSSTVAGEDFGSHMLYAAYLGRRYVSLVPPAHVHGSGGTLLDHLAENSEPDEVRFRDHLPDELAEIYTSLDHAFRVTEMSEADGPEQHRLARAFLGAENLLRRDDLRDALKAAARADRFDRDPPPGGSRSPLMRRQMYRATAAISQARRRTGLLRRRALH